MKHSVIACAVFALMGLTGTWTQAAFAIDTVAVGNVGNADYGTVNCVYDDPYNPPSNWSMTVPYGGVAYNYQISKKEITAGQYHDFLNTVDPTGANANALYNVNMDTNSRGNQITQHVGGLYDFSGRPSGTEADWQNRPVNFVTWKSAAAYCNWLTSGDITKGAYNLTTLTIDRAAAMNSYSAVYALPTADEWYKAAYYDPNKPDGAGYWDYQAKADFIRLPDGTIDMYASSLVSFVNPATTDGGAGHQANWNNYSALAPYYRADVGTFVSSASAYGTLDQGGNVAEWTEQNDPYGYGQKMALGGSYASSNSDSMSVFDSGYYWTNNLTTIGTSAAQNREVGFRVVMVGVVPEPGTVVLLGMAALGGLAYGWRRRRS